jgi:vacuolar-type H+-ATPase subunit E/Vma4
MPQLNDKLLHFTQVLMDEANAETHAVEEEIEAARKQARTRAEDQVLQESYQYIHSEVLRLRTNSGRTISRQMQDNKRKLYLRREEMSREVMDQVRAKLANYVKTPAYRNKLRDLLKDAAAQLGDITRLTLYLRLEDRAYASFLEKSCESLEITVKEGSFAVGGLIVESDERALRVDATFDTALEELNGHFAELFGLSLAD